MGRKVIRLKSRVNLYFDGENEDINERSQQNRRDEKI